MSEWQPIETAPKDGTVILLAFPTMKVWDIEQSRGNSADAWCACGWWGGDWEDGWRCDLVTNEAVDSYGGTHAFSIAVKATHWMPLPEPPK